MDNENCIESVSKVSRKCLQEQKERMPRVVLLDAVNVSVDVVSSGNTNNMTDSETFGDDETENTDDETYENSEKETLGNIYNKTLETNALQNALQHAQKRTELLVSGGGNRAVSFCGALSVLPCDFLVCAGVSSGALVALLLVLGFSPRDIPRQLQSGRLHLLRKTSSPLQFLRSGALLASDDFISWVTELLITHNIPADSTFEHLQRLTGRELRVAVADLDSNDVLVLGPPPLTDAPVLKALLAAVALPGLLEPCEVLPGRWCLDAGVLNNTPISACVQPERAVVLLSSIGLQDEVSWLRCWGLKSDFLVQAELRQHSQAALVAHVPASGCLGSPSAHAFELGARSMAMRLLSLWALGSFAVFCVLVHLNHMES
jgi:predicted acylesterase/phospholipase RssA